MYHTRTPRLVSSFSPRGILWTVDTPFPCYGAGRHIPTSALCMHQSFTFCTS